MRCNQGIAKAARLRSALVAIAAGLTTLPHASSAMMPKLRATSDATRHDKPNGFQNENLCEQSQPLRPAPVGIFRAWSVGHHPNEGARTV
jgi:hypothetical protein